MTKRRHATFLPRPEQLALMPESSGNAINGQGETAFRRPTRIYWHKPDEIPHGRLQEWMVNRFNAVPAYSAVYAKGDRGPRRPDPIAASRIQDSASNWSARVKEFALQHEADLVGIAELDPNWTYEECEPYAEPWIIILGVEMDHAGCRRPPHRTKIPFRHWRLRNSTIAPPGLPRTSPTGYAAQVTFRRRMLAHGPDR